MQILVIVLLVCVAVAQADESVFIQDLVPLMKESGRWADDMTLEELNDNPLNEWPVVIAIKRSNKIVGYFCKEDQWEANDLKDDIRGDLSEVEFTELLTKITKVTFGSGHPRRQGQGSILPIEITDPREISLWVAAYMNHTKRGRMYSMFVPLSDDAGFGFSREEDESIGGICLCNTGVRYYAGNKLVLNVKGHLHEGADMAFGRKNGVLHLLVKAKVPKQDDHKEEGELEKEVDPFEDQSETEKPDKQNKSQQDKPR